MSVTNQRGGNMPSVFCNGSSAGPIMEQSTGNEVSQSKLSCLSFLEKKTRNLEKRKSKLDSYQQKERDGEKLDKDQKEALKNLPVVMGIIECLKETTEHMSTTFAEEEKRLEKQQRKLAKRQEIEKNKQTIHLISQLFKLQQLLEILNNETTKTNFKHGTNGAVVLSEAELNNVGLLHQLLFPTSRTSFEEDAEVVVNYLQGKDGEFGGCNFKVFREAVERIEKCDYFCRGTAQISEKTASVEIKELVQQERDESKQSCEKESTNETVTQTMQLVETDESLPSNQVKPIVESSLETDAPLVLPTTQTSTASESSSTVSQLPVQRASKEPQEILSAMEGSYNFLQESEIDETENPMADLSSCGYSTFEPYAQIPSAYSIAHSHGVVTDAHPLLLQQQHAPYSAHLMSYPQNLVSDSSIYMSHCGMPVSYNSPIAMTQPFTMHNVYTQPIVSHEMSNVMVPTPTYYEMPSMAEQQEVHDPVNFDPQPTVLSDVAETDPVTEAREQLEEIQLEGDDAADLSEKKKFSMNPNADAFFPEFNGEPAPAGENTQGGFGGQRRNGRGGRGGRGPFPGRGGPRGGGHYNGRGGPGGNSQRYPRNDYRQEGHNGFSGDFNGWRGGPRRDRGGRGGNPRGGRGGGRGGFDRNDGYNAGQDAQE